MPPPPHGFLDGRRSRKASGVFITLEGPEGSGKSSQVRLLARDLKRRRLPVVVTREPGGTRLSAALRRLLLHSEKNLAPLAELFLYEADRAQHMAEVVEPALARGRIVISDRHADSTTAYQGDGRGIDRRVLAALNRIATRGRKPDLTILLDVPVERGLRLAREKTGRHDRLERAGVAFHRRVRRGFLKLARREPGRIRVVRQRSGIENTFLQVRNAVDQFLRENNSKLKI